MTRSRNLTLFLVLAAVWGAAFMAIKAGLAYFPPVLYAALRYDVAGVAMLAYAALVVDDPVPRSRGEWFAVANGGVLMIAGYHVLLFIGETDPGVTSAAAAVIVSLNPLLTAGFARAFLPSERLPPLSVLGLVLGLVGAAVLVRPDPSNLVAGSALAKALVFGAAVSFGLGAVLDRRIDADITVESMTAWSMLAGAALMHVVAAGLGESVRDIAWTAEALLALGYLSLAASALGFLIYFDLLDRLGAVEINLVSYVAPVFAALAGWIFLDESPTAATAVGFLVIFAGFLLLKRRVIRQELSGYAGRGTHTESGD